MLKEIKSRIFRENKIKFHKGLNVVLGDSKASNSIGKSTLLMIIDFIFGGETYIKYNNDVITNMGEHSFYYCFEDDYNTFKFKRTTRDSEKIYQCDDNYNIINELNLEQYTNLLKKIYKIDSKYISFREMVSLYSRVWGKDNYDIKKPLNTYIKSKEIDMINNLIKVFNKYDNINDINENIKIYNDEDKALKSGMRFNYIPSINKTKYNNNLKNIEEINTQISILEDKMHIFSTNIVELTNSKIVELNEEKRILSNKKSTYLDKINRIEDNILRKVKLDKKQFEKLLEIFPNANIKRLEEIEKFHANICKFLNKEIQDEKKELNLKVDILNESIWKIDSYIEKTLNIDDVPKYIIETLISITSKLNILKKENEFYDKKIDIKDRLNKEKKLLKEKSKEIILNIEGRINSNMKLICKELLSNSKKAPKLEITDKGYNFYIYDNTGTGNAYISLIILDLAIFKETKIPILIHDSMLFKNIEKDTMEKLILMYNSFDRQVFIAIDEIFKYDKEYRDIIKSKKVIELDKERTLFTKIWNRN